MFYRILLVLFLFDDNKIKKARKLRKKQKENPLEWGRVKDAKEI